MRPARFLTAYVVPLIAALAIFQRGWWMLLPPFFLFALTPIMDVVFGKDVLDLEGDDAAAKWRDARYDFVLWAWIPLQLALQGAAVWAASRATALEFVGITFASGLLASLGINVAHELMHRKGRAERALSEVLMTSVSYGHFCIEHVLGHHKNVSTDADPASARRGELVYAFLVRSIVGGAISGWRLERSRVQRSGARGLARFAQDRRVRLPVMWLALLVAVTLAAGPWGVLAFIAQSAVAIVLLETINYVEHYGLRRAPHERVEPRHSWTSAERITSLYLFNLPRHADHHANASRPYFALRHIAGAPQLPAGYATMLTVALVPPLWHWIMDPRVPHTVAEGAHAVAPHAQVLESAAE